MTETCLVKKNVLFDSIMKHSSKLQIIVYGELIQKFNSRISVSSAFSTATDLQDKPARLLTSTFIKEKRISSEICVVSEIYIPKEAYGSRT